MVGYTKLKSGDWGVKGPADVVKAGATVTVVKKSGETRQERIGRVVWTGSGVSIATIGQAGSASGSPSKGTYYRSGGRGTRTGCSCGSVEEFEKSTDCWNCKHDRD